MWKKFWHKLFWFKEPKSLWYLCSFETFVKMFDKKRMWFSDVVKSNDESELFIGQLIADNMDADFDKVLKDKGIEYAKNQIWDLSKSEIIREIASPCHVWASCFTTNVDNLWMWKEYGDNFNGIAIDFDFIKLKELVSSLNDKNDLVSFYLFPVKYGGSISKNEIANFIKLIKEILLEKMYNQTLLNSFAKYFSKFKTEHFSIENEYRIIALNEVKPRIRKKIKEEKVEAAGNRVIDNFGDELPITKEIKSTTLFKTHVKNNKVVSHIECEINLNELVSSVRFCKNHSKEEIEEIIGLSLGKNQIKVEKQQTSYRTK